MTNKLLQGITIRGDNEYIEVLSSIREVFNHSNLNSIELLGILSILQTDIHQMAMDDDDE